MDFSKLKGFAQKAQEQASKGLDAAKTAAQGVAEDVKGKVTTFTTEDLLPIMDKCQNYFSEHDLNQKLTNVAKTVGAGLVYPVLLLFELLKSAEVDNSQKAMIIGALGYFIVPMDMIAALIPGGFADDLAALTFVVKATAANISDTIRLHTKEQLHEWLGEYDEKLTQTMDTIIEGVKNIDFRK